jgi:hypothetical protein
VAWRGDGTANYSAWMLPEGFCTARQMVSMEAADGEELLIMKESIMGD